MLEGVRVLEGVGVSASEGVGLAFSGCVRKLRGVECFRKSFECCTPATRPVLCEAEILTAAGREPKDMLTLQITT